MGYLRLPGDADPTRTAAEGNASDAGPRRARFALETDAYGQTVFHDIAETGTLEPSGRWPAAATEESTAKVNDGRWHHAIVEADRRARKLTVYVDGKRDVSAEGAGESVSLANVGDLYVGGTPEGRYLDGALDLLRVAQGALADADTTIDELYAREFEGPQLRDFTGRNPAGARNAGAIEFVP